MTRNVLGVRIDDVSESEALAKISEAKEDFLVFTPGPEFLVTASHDDEFKQILNESNLNVPDGVGLRLSGVKNRVPGVDLMMDVLKMAEEKGWSVGLIGGFDGVVGKVVRQFPKIKFKYAVSGDITMPSDRVDVLLVGMGHPKQEKFLFNIVKNHKFRIGMGVGGSFDLITGNKKRAPKFLRQTGFEWLWRGVQNPRHFIRIWKATGEYVWLLLTSRN